MNTSALKNFAPAVRRQLIEAVTRKLDYVLTATTPDLLTTHALQVASLRKLAQNDRNGLIERVSYTWFNRFAALRFIDAHGWHPFRARIITPANPDETQPEILRSALAGTLPAELAPFTDPQRINSLLDGATPSTDPQGEVYRHLVLAACRFYNALLPNLFERLDDETELLLPDDLLTEHSVVHGFRTEISDDDCHEGRQANVEILGWLYQFYISEKKDTVMARKSAVPTEDIPAVTQLFTPHWIVRYLVENSLGRLWLQSRPNSRLREHMPYYIEDAAPEPDAWQKEWHDSISFREGDYTSFMWLRPNPAYKDNYYDSLWYALTIDGYAYAKRVWGIENPESGGASDRMDSFFHDGKISGSFEDLRALLFLWQRDNKWTDSRESEAMYNKCYAAVCEAWDREWREHVAALPKLERLGIRLPDSSPSNEPSTLTVRTPEEIRLCDPACGSAHMLTYAYDLLYLIYEEEGYAPSDIPGLILKHNLFGLEICPRAAQLAELALVFKAREKSRRFFQPEHFVRPNIIELRDVRFEEGELTEYFKAIGINSSTFIPHTSAFPELLYQFENAKNFGSLIQPCLDEQAIVTASCAIEAKDISGQLFLRETHLKVLRVLKQAEALTQRHHVVVANPPYMGNKAQPDTLRLYLKTHFEVGKHDLFSAFILRNRALLLPGGISGMMTPFTWFFILTYSDLRQTLLKEMTFETAIIPEYHSFFESAFVPVCAFVLKAATPRPHRLANFIDLEDFTGADIQESKALEAIRSPTCPFRYSVSASEFANIPGSPFAYKLGSNFLKLVANGPYIGAFAEPREGINTGDNERFLRFWFEVARSAICIQPDSSFDHRKASATTRWFPCNKGGPFRRWYGNNEYVVDWSNDGYDIRNFRDAEGTLLSRPQNTGYFFREGATWSGVGLTGFSARYFPVGFTFNSAGRSLFAATELIPQILAALNANTSFELLKIVSPTLSFTVGNVASLPFKPLELKEQRSKVEQLVQCTVAVARADWDNFETSWDFQDHPLLCQTLKGVTLEASWRNWEAHCTAAIRRMQELETENNRLFIAAYGLEGELQPEVPEQQITLARADARKDMAAFLSYAVGCMLGRYSLYKPGLILANAGDTLADYDRIVAGNTGSGNGVKESSQATAATEGFPLPTAHCPLPTEFRPDEDGILPILDGEWFEDDIVARTRDFLRATFGDETLRENLRFIEDSLGKDLRKYFLNDFYKDHLQTYKKRPIYWLVQSPRKGFSALIYLHRYTRDTLNIVLNRYLRPYQDKLRGRIAHLDQTQADPAAGARDKTAARKEAEKLAKTLHECEEWERDTLLPLAQQRIELDLDDGVKVNYLKLGEALAPIPGLAAKEED